MPHDATQKPLNSLSYGKQTSNYEAPSISSSRVNSFINFTIPLIIVEVRRVLPTLSGMQCCCFFAGYI